MFEVSRSPEATPSTFSRLKLAVALAAGLGLSGCAGDDNASTGPRCMEDQDCDTTTTGGPDETDGSTGGDSYGSTGYEISTSTTDSDSSTATDTTGTGGTEGVECDPGCEEGEVCEEGVCEEMPALLISPLIVNCLIDPNEECTSNAGDNEELSTKVTYTIENAKIEECEASVKVVDGPMVTNDGTIKNFSLHSLDYYGGGPAGVTERITISCDNGWKTASNSVDVLLTG